MPLQRKALKVLDTTEKIAESAEKSVFKALTALDEGNEKCKDALLLIQQADAPRVVPQPKEFLINKANKAAAVGMK